MDRFRCCGTCGYMLYALRLEHAARRAQHSRSWRSANNTVRVATRQFLKVRDLRGVPAGYHVRYPLPWPYAVAASYYFTARSDPPCFDACAQHRGLRAADPDRAVEADYASIQAAEGDGDPAFTAAVLRCCRGAGMHDSGNMAVRSLSSLFRHTITGPGKGTRGL